MALPFYVALILLIARFHQRKRLEENPIYKYYLRGLVLKIFGGIVFALIYYYYYQGGDTFSYYESALTMKNLMFQSFPDFLKNEFGSASTANFALFSPKTGYPLPYMYWDTQTLTVIKLITPIMLLSFSGYLISTVIVAWLSYSGVWKLFLVFSSYYPQLKGRFFIAIVCFPSVIFWGSGILKDTITLSSIGWIVYSIYNAFILKRKIVLYLLLLIPFAIVVLYIKPYIIFALLPGSLMWVFSNRIYKIRNTMFKLLIIPVIFLLCLGGGYFIVQNLGDYMGKFSVDKITTTAIITENDLKKDYYGGHSFDIGSFENTPSGYAKIFPKAFIAGAYRPFIWESGSLVMLISGIENLFLLYLTFLALARSRLRIFKRLFKEPLLFFAFSYSIFFAFAVGLTTSNFGSLVRFKIAYLPFFTACLYILSWKEKVSEYEEAETDELNASHLTGSSPEVTTD